MNVDGPLLNGLLDVGSQFDTMVSTGVESVRIAFDWGVAQPYRSFAALRAAGGDPTAYQDIGGVPTSFAATDPIVGLAAQRHLQIVPVVLFGPDWDAAKFKPFPGAHARPAKPGPYANYLKDLVIRYGPHGTYWSENPTIPRVPIRMWQVWNEPSIPSYWPNRPWVKDYVKLLIAAHAAIKQADRGAKVVLAGLPNFSWQYLRNIYKVPGARAAFDVVAVHPYTAQPSGVITILNAVRNVMNAAGDSRKPMLASEVGWPSSRGKASQSLGTTEAGQAADVAAVLPLLAANRVKLRLIGFDFYSWIGDEYRGAAAFHYSGLFRYNDKTNHVIPKPAWKPFRRAALKLEHCRSKGTVATACAKAG
jgi:polysaccharide biosynthesis protein PslG